jgi:hypothetical protein
MARQALSYGALAAIIALGSVVGLVLLGAGLAWLAMWLI